MFAAIARAMRRLSVAQRLAALALVLAVPLGQATWLRVSEQNAVAATEQREVDALRYLAPLETLLFDLERSQVEQAYEQPTGASITADVAAVDRVDAKFGDSFGTVPAWHALRAELTAITPNARGVDFATTGADAASVVRIVIDNAKLQAQSDISTFHALQALLVELPALGETVADAETVVARTQQNTAEPGDDAELGAAARELALANNRLQTEVRAAVLATDRQASGTVEPAALAVAQAAVDLSDQYVNEARGGLTQSLPAGDQIWQSSRDLSAALADFAYRGVTARLEATLAAARAESAAIAAVLLVAVLIFLGYARLTARDVQAVVRELRLVADGDLADREPSSARDEFGQMSRAVAEARTRLAASLAATESQEMLFRTLVEESSDFIATTDSGGVVHWVSPSIRPVLGHLPQDCVGTAIARFVHVDDLAAVRANTRELVREDGAGRTFECRLRGADGEWRRFELHVRNLLADPHVRALVWNSRDVTERRRLEEKLTHQAFHDELTGLANRALFADRLQLALRRLEREARPVGVLLLDLDGFKDVNDSLGHGAGDELLVEIGGRIAASLRPGDTVARLGGDEFAVLLPDLPAGDAVAHDTLHELAERILDNLADPLDSIDAIDAGVRVHASVGAVLATEPRDAAELLRDADVAMYAAKARGKACVAVFEPAMHAKAKERLELSTDLDGAVENGELQLLYQPLIDLATGELEGSEALLRWVHPVRGVVTPLSFIPLAEETGAILPIGRWVLFEACRQTARWRAQFPAAGMRSVHVNLSGRQLLHGSVVGDVRTALTETGLPAEDLVLEITESVLLDDVETVRARLAELKSLGVRIAVDDFGTGYSSLAYLRRFPVDILKIDKSFVDALGSRGPGGHRDASETDAIVASIISLGDRLAIETVAEGVEELAQAEELREAGCGFAQGYLFSRPVPPAELEALLAAEAAGAAVAAAGISAEVRAAQAA